MRYLASRDGWDPVLFADRCNNKSNLLFLVASSSPAHGGVLDSITHIFGASTALPWQKHGGFKEDSAAFLFSVRAAGEAGYESAVPPMFTCQQIKATEYAVMHHSTLAQHDGKFWAGGPLFGAGPDLHIDLEDPTRCTSQLGSTFMLPRACAVTREGPAFLAGSSPFHALDLAVIQQVDSRAADSAAQDAAARASRREVDLNRIHSIGEWLEDQDIGNPNMFAGDTQRELKPLMLSPALVVTRKIISSSHVISNRIPMSRVIQQRDHEGKT